MEAPYAHSCPDGPFEPLLSDSTACSTLLGGSCALCEKLEPQHGHLNKVAFLCARFACDMFASPTDREMANEWGRLLGLWHDLGKFSPEWQAYLKAKVEADEGEISGKEDHSTAGAQHADRKAPALGRLMAYLIAGHHAGLPNGMDETGGCLEKRLVKVIRNVSAAPAEILHLTQEIPFPNFAQNGQAMAFFMRMMFSCLVDADYLATEAFMRPQAARARPDDLPTIQGLAEELDRRLGEFGTPKTEVNRRRAEILDACRAKAAAPPGLFSLTVPTGGGKTLSSLAFALHHARIHGLRRVIYVIPYTSIIEQNAKVFRDVFATLGAEVVLEHHSNLSAERAEATTYKLAAENWDARLIVTTNVRFFEALHANRTSACRRLHRIARSVVVLDEAQCLPIEYMQTCLRSLEELTDHYGVTVVLCTATQPAIERRPDFKIGLRTPVEIIPNPKALYHAMRRVRTERLGRIENDAIAARLAGCPQVLCIVNTRRHARELAEMLPECGENVHLSALMCPEHRAEKLQMVRSRLANGQPVRVVSTQLIEAGVDIDFPVVFRSIAGLDSIAQAAGRCDREGLRTAQQGQPAGRLFVFSSPTPPPSGQIRAAADCADQIFTVTQSDPLDLDTIEAYFRLHYWTQSHAMDTKNILKCWPNLGLKGAENLFQFKDCAERFKWIDDYTEPVIIPYGSTGRDLCEKLCKEFNPTEQRRLARQLQRFIVNIPTIQHARLLATGIIQLYHETFPVLVSDVHYSERFGLHPDPDIHLPPTQTII